MDMSLMSAEQQEKAARWRKLGELGMEGALRECGASDETIFRLVSELQFTVADLDDSQIDWDVPKSISTCDWGFQFMGKKRESQGCLQWKLSEIEKDLNIDDAKCVFLAVLGRGAPLVKSLAVGESRFPVKKKRKPFSSLTREESDTEERYSDADFQVVLTFQELSEDELIALCVNLATNDNLREFCLTYAPIFKTEIGRRLLAQAFAANTSIRIAIDGIYGWDVGSFGCDVLKVSKSVRVLGLSPDLGSQGIKNVALLLKANTTLKCLDMGLESDAYGGRALPILSSSLAENTGLSHLQWNINTSQSGSVPLASNLLLAPFIHDGSSVPKNTAITSLQISFEGYSGSTRTTDLAADLSAMIRTNKILTELRIWDLDLGPEEWCKQVLPSLGQNRTLKHLGLDGCRGLGQGLFDWTNFFDPYDIMMNAVQSGNTKLETISLENTGLETKEAGLAAELRVNQQYRLILKNHYKRIPTTGRLVLCGYEFAGKTTIRKTAARVQGGGQMSSRQNIQLVREKFLQNHPHMRRWLFGTDAVLELQSRTRGIEIVKLEKAKIRVWDFAGQVEFYALHDYLFPNSENSCFLYVCNAKCPPTTENHGRRELWTKEAMKDRFRYWLQFIVSNTKPAQGVSAGQNRLPHVIFVLTGKDTLGEAERRTSEEHAKDIVLQFKEEFEEVISLSQKVQFINAHNSEDVEKLLTTVQDVVAEILGQSTEYVICADVRDKLSKWVRSHPSRPIVSLTDFRQQIWEKVVGYDTIEMRVVLAYLNDAGDVIYLNPRDFIVVNPAWFGVGVMGSLLNTLAGTADPNAGSGVRGCFRSKPFKQNAWISNHENGFVRRRRIDDLLQKTLQSGRRVATSSDELVKLMIDLELCFQERPDDPQSRLFIPALFDKVSDEKAGNGLRKLKWEAKFPPNERLHFVGRRLECKNKLLTFLTPGLFPRLQVVLGNFLHERKWAGLRAACNLFGFVHNGMEVLVEYSGALGFFVDILVRSSKSCEETQRFIKENVIHKIREFCASPQGCQGVELEEAIIRPICVEKLYSCAERVPHAVLVSDLQTSMKEGDGSKYRHTWREPIRDVYDFDFALDLLHGKGSYARFIAANQVNVSTGLSSSGATGVPPRYSQLSLDLPRRFYPTIEDLGFMTRLDAKTNLAKVMPIKLHLMCDGLEGIDDAHEIKDQPGRNLKLNAKLGGYDFPIVKYAVRLLWAGVKIAASTVNVSAEVDQIDEKLKQMSDSPVVQLSVDMLISIMQQRNASGQSAAHQKVPPEDILQYLKEYMQMDPSAQWLVDFLNLQDSEGFFKDFNLFKVRSKITKEISWLCGDHYNMALGDICTVESVPLCSVATC